MDLHSDRVHRTSFSDQGVSGHGRHRSAGGGSEQSADGLCGPGRVHQVPGPRSRGPVPLGSGELRPPAPAGRPRRGPPGLQRSVPAPTSASRTSPASSCCGCSTMNDEYMQVWVGAWLDEAEAALRPRRAARDRVAGLARRHGPEAGDDAAGVPPRRVRRRPPGSGRPRPFRRRSAGGRRPGHRVLRPVRPRSGDGRALEGGARSDPAGQPRVHAPVQPGRVHADRGPARLRRHVRHRLGHLERQGPARGDGPQGPAHGHRRPRRRRVHEGPPDRRLGLARARPSTCPSRCPSPTSGS